MPIRNVVATRYLPIEVLVHTYVQYILYEHELTVRRKKESNQSSNSKNQYQRTSIELYERISCTVRTYIFYIPVSKILNYSNAQVEMREQEKII